MIRKEQEFSLSPDTTAEKLEESLRLTVARVGDREGFRQWLESHPRRRWLKARVVAIQNAAIQDVLLPDQEDIYKRFLGDHSRLAPRHQRDLPRILALIKASAILNCWHRKYDDHTIIANKDDIEAGFWLYGLVARPNELGLSPQVYQLYEGIIQPLLAQHGLVDRKQILTEYHRQYGRFLADEKLRREVLPALEASGLITQSPDPDDKRRMLVCGSTIDPPPISPPETIGGTSEEYALCSQRALGSVLPQRLLRRPPPITIVIEIDTHTTTVIAMGHNQGPSIVTILSNKLIGVGTDGLVSSAFMSDFVAE